MKMWIGLIFIIVGVFILGTSCCTGLSDGLVKHLILCKSEFEYQREKKYDEIEYQIRYQRYLAADEVIRKQKVYEEILKSLNEVTTSSGGKNETVTSANGSVQNEVCRKTGTTEPPGTTK